MTKTRSNWKFLETYYFMPLLRTSDSSALGMSVQVLHVLDRHLDYLSLFDPSSALLEIT